LYLDAYYDLRGWDKETGKPTREKLTELGLEDLIPDVWG
jgi:aldehyde:ferredoxin oxidoreductase